MLRPLPRMDDLYQMGPTSDCEVWEICGDLLRPLCIGDSTNELKNYFLILGGPPQLSPPMPVPFLPYGVISVTNPIKDALRLPLKSKLTVKVLNST